MFWDGPNEASSFLVVNCEESPHIVFGCSLLELPNTNIITNLLDFIMSFAGHCVKEEATQKSTEWR